MAITATTLSGAVSVTDTFINVAATTGISAPTTTTGVGYTYLQIEQELLFVIGAPVGTLVPVLRGQNGTVAAAHATSAPVLIGGRSDFPNFKPQVYAFQALGEVSIGAPLTGAVITPTGGQIHHFTGSTALTTIVPPDSSRAWVVQLIFDGSGSGLTWSAATGANTISITGTVSQYQIVSFIFDPTTVLWYPNTIT